MATTTKINGCQGSWKRRDEQIRTDDFSGSENT